MRHVKIVNSIILEYRKIHQSVLPEHNMHKRGVLRYFSPKSRTKKFYEKVRKKRM